jgi:hypothetical protein
VANKSFSVLTVSKRTGWEEQATKQVYSQTFSPENWIIVQEGVNAPEPIRASNLNRSLNHGLKQINSEYVVFYQDFIELQPDCFEKLLALADEKTFVTTCTPNYDNSDDSRYLGIDGPRPCRPEEWEANVAIAPMKAMRELGGFCEEYDNGWSWDNVNVAERAAMLGYKFIIDESNRPRLLPHEQTSKLEMKLNGDRHAKEMEAIRNGWKPLKYNYL